MGSRDGYNIGREDNTVKMGQEPYKFTALWSGAGSTFQPEIIPGENAANRKWMQTLETLETVAHRTNKSVSDVLKWLGIEEIKEIRKMTGKSVEEIIEDLETKH